MNDENTKELVTIIVQRKDGQRALDAATKAGAPGVTYFYARGTGIRQKLGMLGMFIEAEKQIIMVAVEQGEGEKILNAITKALELDKPGKGFGFIQPIYKVVGYYADK